MPARAEDVPSARSATDWSERYIANLRFRSIPLDERQLLNILGEWVSHCGHGPPASLGFGMSGTGHASDSG
jgi:hypothetical protein